MNSFSATNRKIVKNNEIEKIPENLEKSSKIVAVILKVNCDDRGKIKVQKFFVNSFSFWI